jgi:hypothetical protein
MRTSLASYSVAFSQKRTWMSDNARPVAIICMNASLRDICRNVQNYRLLVHVVWGRMALAFSDHRWLLRSSHLRVAVGLAVWCCSGWCRLLLGWCEAISLPRFLCLISLIVGPRAGCRSVPGASMLSLCRMARRTKDRCIESVFLAFD